MTCLGCWRCEEENNLRTLRDGRNVCSWCDDWKSECADYEAKARQIMTLKITEMALEAKILQSIGYDIDRIKKIILRMRNERDGK